jgi:Acyl-CoA reductase (LuxC)
MIAVRGTDRSSPGEVEFTQLIEGMAEAHANPFSTDLVDLTARISAQILKNPITRAVPQYVALGYWMRAAGVKRLVDAALAAVPEDEVVAPRGLALHLPPVNVDTIFVYSWTLSLLAGNSNVVRLPASVSRETEALLEIITDALGDASVGARQLFCTYPYGGDLEQRISRFFDLRIIWGGDAKVDAVSRIPIRPDGLSIGFPDRQSLALISLSSYADASAEKRAQLAVQLFNDAYWFDQMGCSSPRLLAWVGTGAGWEDLSRDLYCRLQSVIERKSYQVEPAVAVSKLVRTYDLLAGGTAHRGVRYSNELQVVGVADPLRALQQGEGGGFFSECRLDALADLRTLVTRKLQTITHFGFDTDELIGLARLIAGYGAYRIVPVGQALNFDDVWDGVPLLSHMTRRIVVKTK